jgi:hypothetical protein
MPSPRFSTSSGRSGDATVVDPNSLPPSPIKITGCGERRASSDNVSKPATTGTRSYSASHASSKEQHFPQERYGWPKLAEKMAKVPEFAAFSRFSDLNVRNLLYYQAQIKSLRTKILKTEEVQDRDMDRYDALVDEGDSDYHMLLMELRGLLRDYSA